ncbi:SLC13 family permease [Pseudomonadota bacterium]|nr:SLC13 family permease [Alphaproteobacteria bacterium]MDC1357371.1 SLC13 family permease [Pseudomonadota bacterium]
MDLTIFDSITDQNIISFLMIMLVALFIWGKIRYDAVSLIMLSLFVIFGFISASEAFSGLGHPAVVTVALVLLISKGLEKSGFISFVGMKIQKIIHSETQFILILCLIAAFLSSFMNNIGAMAMLLPITISICQKMEWNPSKFLMPLAFASILGGMNTKIGTPPNIIISELRGEYSSNDFSFFDFAFAGVPVSIIGIIFIMLIGWRLIPIRPINSLRNPLINLDDYLVEMKVDENSPLIDKRAYDLRSLLDDDTSLIGQIDEDDKKSEIHGNQKIYEGQILILKINPDYIAEIQKDFGLSLNLEKAIKNNEIIAGIEAIIIPKSRLIGRKYNYFKRLIGGQLSLLGLWRRGLKYRFRLSNEIFKSGDVLLIANRGEVEKIGERLELAGLMPLWQREFDIVNDTSKIFLAIVIFLLSLSSIIFNFLPIIVAFLLCVLAFASIKLLTGDSIYRHIDWPVVVLLAAMIPIGNTLTEYGITSSISSSLAQYSNVLNVVWILIILMVITMFLSDVINNAATAVIMAPIAANVAIETGQSVDAFLMCVAIGASCAFLSPIGHQCNTLVMGPGNYKFGDYWKLGLPLEILIICISIPIIVFFWT